MSVRSEKSTESDAARVGSRRARGWTSTFTSLSERDYAWYFAGNFAFFMGMQMQMILRGYLALKLTNVAIALGLVAASVAIPMMLVAPFGGTVADRVDKRKLLIISQTGSAIAALIMALLILSDAVEFWHLLVMSLVTGTIMSFNMPARQAIVPQLVPQHKLMNAISLQQAGMNLTRILAPATAGLLIGPFGVGVVYLITFVLFLVAVASEFHLPVHGMKAIRKKAPFREDFLGGFKYIRDHRMIALLLSLGLVFPLLGFPLQQMLPVFARDVFNDDGGSKLGLLAASQGIGGLAGAMIAANLGGFPQKGKLMLVGGLWMGGLFIAFTQMSMFIPALFMLALGNVGGMIFQTTNNTVIQSNIPAEVRGRVMSVMMMSFGLMPLGVLPVAAAADRFGPDVAVAGSSTLLLVALVAFFTLSRRLRTLRTDEGAVLAQLVDDEDGQEDRLIGNDEDEEQGAEQHDREGTPFLEGPAGAVLRALPNRSAGGRDAAGRAGVAADSEQQQDGDGVEHRHQGVDGLEGGDGEQDAAHDAADDAHAVLGGLAHRDGGAERFDGHQGGEDRLSRGLEEGDGDALQRDQRDHLPGLDPTAEQQRDEGQAGDAVEDLRGDEDVTSRIAVHEGAGKHAEDKVGGHTSRNDRADKEGGVGQFEDENRAGDLVHPMRGGARDHRGPEHSEVAIAEGREGTAQVAGGRGCQRWRCAQLRRRGARGGGSGRRWDRATRPTRLGHLLLLGGSAAEQVGQTLAGELVGLGVVDDDAFAILNALSGLSDLRCDFVWDLERAMLVGVQKVAGMDRDAADGHRLADLDEVHIGMRDEELLGEELEAELTDLIQIANAAVCDEADGVQGMMNVAVDFAPEGADGRLVEVLDDDDAGRGHALNEGVPFEGGLALGILGGGDAGADLGGGGVAHDGRQLRESAQDVRAEEAGRAALQVEGFDRVADGGGGPGLKGLEL